MGINMAHLPGLLSAVFALIGAGVAQELYGGESWLLGAIIGSIADGLIGLIVRMVR